MNYVETIDFNREGNAVKNNEKDYAIEFLSKLLKDREIVDHIDLNDLSDLIDLIVQVASMHGKLPEPKLLNEISDVFSMNSPLE